MDQPDNYKSNISDEKVNELSIFFTQWNDSDKFLDDLFHYYLLGCEGVEPREMADTFTFITELKKLLTL